MEPFRVGVSERCLSCYIFLDFPGAGQFVQLFLDFPIRAVSSAILLYKCQALISGYCWPSSCES